jgi:hypothetical protein
MVRTDALAQCYVFQPHFVKNYMMTLKCPVFCAVLSLRKRRVPFCFLSFGSSCEIILSGKTYMKLLLILYPFFCKFTVFFLKKYLVFAFLVLWNWDTVLIVLLFLPYCVMVILSFAVRGRICTFYAVFIKCYLHSYFFLPLSSSLHDFLQHSSVICY